jgi:hypothetical protein
MHEHRFPDDLDDGTSAAAGPAAEAPATGVPPIPGPPPGIPDPDRPGGGEPPVNLGVMDPD